MHDTQGCRIKANYLSDRIKSTQRKDLLHMSQHLWRQRHKSFGIVENSAVATVNGTKPLAYFGPGAHVEERPAWF